MNISTYLGFFTALTAGDHIITRDEIHGVIFRVNIPEQTVNFSSGKVSLNATSVNRIIFITHGWMESRKVEWFQDLTRALLDRDKNNIVVQVDWSKGSKLNRPAALRNNPIAGGFIGEFVSELVELNHISLSNVHMIGFSMGGQVTGFAAKTIKEKLGEKIGRVTAFDPSGRGYNDEPETKRLNPNDAEVVAVLHTDAVKIGFSKSCGTVDIFFNGIVFPQPGCPDQLDLVDLKYCSHYRAPKYFVEGVQRGSLIGTKCDSYENYLKGLCSDNEILDFVGAIPNHARGVFYTKTNSKPPFLG